MSDRPIHLEGLAICNREPHSEPSVVVPVWITQSSLDGLFAMMQVCDGFEKSGKGRLNGWFELTMFYRTLRECIYKAEEAARKEANNG